MLKKSKSLLIQASTDLPQESIITALRLAGDILSDPRKRTMGTLAENNKGNPVNPASPTACRWCLSGAIGKACHDSGITATKDQIAVYKAAKDKIGIPDDVESPVFWDHNPQLHDLMVSRLQKAE